jgi:tetratricopeptide (TPR) repeat protein
MVPEEAVPLCQTALAISLESESLSDIAWARFMLGFSQLWAGDLDEAEKQILVALALAERTGDIVHQSRCLTYLTILYRLGGQLAQAQRYARQSLASAEGAQMLEYTGTAYANLAWVAWRERDMASAEKYGQAALESWQKLPTGHSSCAFQWTAVWPLAAVALRSDQIARACSLLSALLDPSQQHLPDALEETVREAISAWEEDNLEVARNHVQQAIGLAQESGYL